MPLETLTAVSAVDGRYHNASSALSDYFSEFALIRARVSVECEYLMALSEAGVGMRALSEQEKQALRSFSDISLDDARMVKKLEREGHDNVPATNHDVKAVEYLLKQKMQGTSLEDVSEWTHFALTSEDVNSTAYGLILSSFVEKLLLPSLEQIRGTLEKLSREHAAAAMLSRTHGQAASPTTFGKEMRVFEVAPCASDAAAFGENRPRQIWRRHRKLERAYGRSAEDRLARIRPKVHQAIGWRPQDSAGAQRGHHADRAARHLCGAVRQCAARQYHPDRPLAGHLALYLRRLDPAEAQGRAK